MSRDLCVFMMLYLFVAAALFVPMELSAVPETQVVSEQDVTDATVIVFVMTRTDYKTGSGVIIDTDGTIVTARHVVEDAVNIMVMTDDGVYEMAEVAAVSDVTDVAVITIEGEDYSYMEASEEVTPGQEIYVVGSPFGSENFNYVTSGVVSRIDVAEEFFGDYPMFMVDAIVSPGNSGGPVVDANTGELLGIIVGSNRRGVQFNYVIYIEHALELVD